MRIQTHKLVSALLIGFLYGLYLHHTYVKWHRLGRAAFLEHEGQRFDRYMAIVSPTITSVFGAVIVLLVVVSIYELIALGLQKFIGTTASGVPSSTTGQL